jgi:protein involved in polysaccharide export with SLBB domain
MEHNNKALIKHGGSMFIHLSMSIFFVVAALTVSAHAEIAHTRVGSVNKAATAVEPSNIAAAGSKPEAVLNFGKEDNRRDPTDSADDTRKIPIDIKAERFAKNEYTVGIDDVLDVLVLQPEKIATTVTVMPDGSVSLPYIGSVRVKDLSITEVQQSVQRQLSDGYMRYPVVSVSLRESRSRKFFVYGEVMKPGSYLLQENTTVLRAISQSGGFTKFGSSSRVKVMRPYKDKPGYQPIKVNINEVMNGNADADVVLESGDIVVINEGVF